MGSEMCIRDRSLCSIFFVRDERGSYNLFFVKSLHGGQNCPRRTSLPGQICPGGNYCPRHRRAANSNRQYRDFRHKRQDSVRQKWSNSWKFGSLSAPVRRINPAKTCSDSSQGWGPNSNPDGPGACGAPLPPGAAGAAVTPLAVS